ncbi:MAG TPA: PAS domain S-box protein [Candidatus Brocadiia bacterium]|nr:PAS domain S-box protein [Candidatus Brocadiia bacterium]
MNDQNQSDGASGGGAVPKPDMALLLKASGDVIFTIDAVTGRYIYVSESGQSLSGFTAQEDYAVTVWDRHPESEYHLLREMMEHVDSGQTAIFRVRLKKKDGGEVPIEVYVIRDGNVYHGVARDISGRIETEEKLRAAMLRFRTLFDNVPEAVWVVDRATSRFIDVNRTTIERYGYTREEFAAMDLFQIRPPEDVDDLKRRMDDFFPSGPLHIGELRHRKKDGTIFPVDVYLQRLQLPEGMATIVVAVDLTERKRAENEQEKLRAQVYQMNKMDSIGRLTGGVAHTFNNLLSGILGFAELGCREADSDSQLLGYFQAERSAALRAMNLTRQLMVFSNRERRKSEAIDLNALLEETRELLSWTVEESIRLTTRLDPELPAMTGDPEQIQQVIMNLCINARDAISDGGSVMIETKKVDNPGLPQLAAVKRKVPFLRLSVHDSGAGIPAEIQDKIFEPFFTTKKEGEGMGLGLAVVYGIVRDHDGCIIFDSQEGVGTRFDVYFPAAGQAPKSVPKRQEPVKTGTRTILLVDDEELVRRTGKKLLEKLGYRAILASSGEEAVAIHASRAREIALTIMDIVMPGINGQEAFNRMRKADPGAKVIFCTGYGRNLIPDDLTGGDNMEYLQKPFLMSHLQRAIDRLLGGGGTASPRS